MKNYTYLLISFLQKKPVGRKPLKEAWATTTAEYVKPAAVPTDLQETGTNR